MSLTPLRPPLVHPARSPLPVLLSVPHSGRAYPEWLLALAAGSRASLEALEDPLVDQLAAGAIARGTGAVIAQAPRAAIDCNRAEDDVDPSVVEGCRHRRVTMRARGGLGIVPARTQRDGYLWRRPLTLHQLEQRLDEAHRPYHRAVSRQLEALTAGFGCALLLDCHSMPSAAKGGPQIVIGDRYGRSAAPWLTAQAVRICRSAGFVTAVNDPFAGGHVVERHGNPVRDVHALQIEVDRAIYLDPSMTRSGSGFAAAAALLETLVDQLGEALLAGSLATAAE